MDLTRVLADLEERRAEIQKEERALDAAIKVLKGLGGSTRTQLGRRRGRLSAAARKRISDAQKKRWAKFKKQKRAA